MDKKNNKKIVKELIYFEIVCIDLYRNRIGVIYLLFNKPN